MKILLIDIESSPNVSLTWGKYDQNVLHFVRHRQIITVAWKWLGEKKVYGLSLPMFPTYKKDPLSNRELMREIHKLMNQADIVIGHNVRCFDDKRIDTDLIKWGFKPPSPHRVIDTLEVARQRFDFNSNKLGDLGEFLGVGGKVKHPGMQMWIDCMDGKPEAWNHMLRYNKGDVYPLLEKVYLKMRPWIRNHPDLNILTEREVCPYCSSPKIQARGWSITKTVAKRKRFQCQGCGGWLYGIYKPKQKLWKFKPA